MADLTRFQFDSNQVEPKKAFEVMPAGTYTAVIIESDMASTKAGTGEYLKLVFEVIDGEHKGRKLYANLNLDNPNQTAVSIARAELSAICRAVGVGSLSDSSMLHDKPMAVKLGVEKDKNTGEMQNRIKDYAKAGSAPTAPAANAATDKPWMKRA